MVELFYGLSLRPYKEGLDSFLWGKKISCETEFTKQHTFMYYCPGNGNFLEVLDLVELYWVKLSFDLQMSLLFCTLI